MKTLKPFGVWEKPSHLSRTSLLNSWSKESHSNFTTSMKSRWKPMKEVQAWDETYIDDNI